MAAQSLSSALTVVFKLVFPSVWILGFGIGTYAVWSDVLASGNTSAVSHEQIMFALAWILGTLFLFFLCIPLKEVNVDDDVLRISNFRREIVVPFDQIERVTENRLININPVTIRFRRPTEFGASVVFMPKTRIFGLFTPHPVVAQLERLAGAARNGRL